MTDKVNKLNKNNEVKEEVFELHNLKKEFKTSDSIFMAVLSLKNWKTGKMITKKEYTSSIEEFLSLPAGGR